MFALSLQPVKINLCYLDSIIRPTTNGKREQIGMRVAIHYKPWTAAKRYGSTFPENVLGVKNRVKLELLRLPPQRDVAKTPGRKKRMTTCEKRLQVAQSVKDKLEGGEAASILFLWDFGAQFSKISPHPLASRVACNA